MVRKYDVAIIGGGVSGTALAYVLKNYTNVSKITIIEKEERLASVNSHRNMNSQTLHFGDIETNYSLEKAAAVKRAADMVKFFILKNDLKGESYTKYHKMVLAVGKNQASNLRERYKSFKKLFPENKLIEKAEIAKLEPKVVNGRDKGEELLAFWSPDGYTMDYQKLSEIFVKNSPGVDLNLKKRVLEIFKDGDGYELELDSGERVKSKVVIVTCGAHSLLFAKSLGYGKDLALFCIAGSFYFVPESLNGKVYTIQNDKLPFAAIHGDPDVHEKGKTRFGPTAKAVFMLERHRYKTIFEYIRSVGFSWRTAVSFFKINSDPVISTYILKNLLYDVPFIGRRLFLKEVRKVVPLTKLSGLHYAKGYGGVRPQIVNNKTFSLDMGEAKLNGDNIIFNITPSPGASTCLQNAEDDTLKVMEFLGKGFKFDRKKFEKDLVCGPECWSDFSKEGNKEKSEGLKKKDRKSLVSEESVLSFG